MPEKDLEEICICLSSDDRFAPYLGVTIQSVLETAAPIDQLHFFVLDDGISPQHKAELEGLQRVRPFRLTWLMPDMKVFAGAFTTSTWPRTCYARLLLGSLLPLEVKRVIYMDCDVFVRTSLAGLWSTDLHGCVLGGVLDIGVMREASLGKHPWPLGEAYINSGVLLVDVVQWRAQNVETKLLDYVACPRHPLQCPDQDVINFVLHKQIALLDPRWNAQIFWARPEWDSYEGILPLRQALTTAYLLHYCCSNKPWHLGGGASVYRKEYCIFMGKTPWKNCFMKVRSNGQILRDILRYWWRHPVCFMKLSFWRKVKMDGYSVFR